MIHSLQYNNQIIAHGRCEIPYIIKNWFNPTEIISIGHDGFLRVWDSISLKIVKQIRIWGAYLTSLFSCQEGIYLGLGTGELVHLDSNFSIINKVKIHIDCISDIIQVNEYLLTVGYDGKINLLKRPSLTIQLSYSVDNLITHAMKYQNKIYFAGTPSHQLDLVTKKLQKLQNSYLSFAINQNKLYGCSDERGLTCLTDNQDTFIPCEHILSIDKQLLLFSEESIAIVENRNDEISWRNIKMPILKTGYSITSTIKYDKCIFAASEDGTILFFQLEYL